MHMVRGSVKRLDASANGQRSGFNDMRFRGLELTKVLGLAFLTLWR